MPSHQLHAAPCLHAECCMLCSSVCILSVPRCSMARPSRGLAEICVRQSAGSPLSVPDSGGHLTGERALERIGNILLILSRAPCESCFLRARTSLPTILRRPVKPTFAIWSLGRPQRSTREALLDATVPRQTSPIRDPPRLPAAGPTRHSKPWSTLAPQSRHLTPLSGCTSR